MNDRYERYQRLHESKAVYLVRDIETSDFFVQKIYKYHDGMIYSRLLGLSIPGVPKVISYEQLDDEHVCVVEEYIKGSNLADYISEHGAMSAETVIDYGIRLCNILEELHKLTPSIIHRDIKPSNILLSDDGRLWLIDFNAAKEFHDDKTSDTYYIGTKDFAAPEQFGFGYSDVRTDVYGLGKTLLYMVNGGYSKQIPENLPSRLRNAIVKSTYTDTDRRYQNIIKMRKALEKSNTPALIGGIAGVFLLIAIIAFGISSLFSHEELPVSEAYSTSISDSTVQDATATSTSVETSTVQTTAVTHAPITSQAPIASSSAATQQPTTGTAQAPTPQSTTQAPATQPATQAPATAAPTQPSTAATEGSTQKYTDLTSVPIYDGEFE